MGKTGFQDHALFPTTDFDLLAFVQSGTDTLMISLNTVVN